MSKISMRYSHLAHSHKANAVRVLEEKLGIFSTYLVMQSH